MPAWDSGSAQRGKQSAGPFLDAIEGSGSQLFGYGLLTAPPMRD